MKDIDIKNHQLHGFRKILIDEFLNGKLSEFKEKNKQWSNTKLPDAVD